MKTSSWDSFQIAIVLAVGTLITLRSLARCATITWTNTSGGNWSVANILHFHRLGVSWHSKSGVYRSYEN